MPSVSVPPSFFVSERNTVYADWRTSFWRELLSNSLDAGASRIRIRTRLSGDHLQADIVDNGCGMSREVIEDVYMRLGASTKADGEGIGGFGRARILTCFSQDGYRIRTSDIVVTGQGASYDIESAGRPVKGCAVTIRMPAREVRRLHRGLERALRQSSLRCAIDLDLADRHSDGSEVRTIAPELLAPGEDGWQRFRGWSRKGRFLETLSDEDGPWASLHVNEGAQALKNLAIVRLQGMAMYEEHIHPAAQLVVDLDPARARKVLTASRDSIRSPFREALQQVFSRIGADRTSGLRARPADPVTHVTLGETHGDLGRPLSRGDPAVRIETHADTHASSLDPGHAVQEVPRGPMWPGALQLIREDLRRISGLREAVIVHVADPTPAQRAVAPRYSGETWLAPGGEGRTAELLHAAWTAACGKAVEALCRIRPSEMDREDRWATGFVFDRNMGACHMRVQGVRNALLLNPVDAEGRMRFRTSDPASMKRMVALAVHEVCHIREAWHDEAFATLMTDITGELRDRDVEQAMRSAMEEVRDRQRHRQQVDAQGPDDGPAGP